jgi:hypothetical protein
MSILKPILLTAGLGSVCGTTMVLLFDSPFGMIVCIPLTLTSGITCAIAWDEWMEGKMKLKTVMSGHGLVLTEDLLHDSAYAHALLQAMDEHDAIFNGSTNEMAAIRQRADVLMRHWGHVEPGE